MTRVGKQRECGILIFFYSHVHILRVEHADRNVYWMTSLSFPLLFSRENYAPACRVLLWKLTVPQLVKKSLSYDGTQMFIAVFTTAQYLSLSRTRWMQCRPSHIIYLRCIFNIILPSMPRRFLWSLYFGFPPSKFCSHFLSHACHICHLTPSPWFDQ